MLDTLMLTAWHGIRHCVATQPGRSVNTEPIGSVLRYLDEFGSSETGIDRFVNKFGTEVIRFSFGIYRTVPN